MQSILLCTYNKERICFQCISEESCFLFAENIVYFMHNVVLIFIMGFKDYLDTLELTQSASNCL